MYSDSINKLSKYVDLDDDKELSDLTKSISEGMDMTDRIYKNTTKESINCIFNEFSPKLQEKINASKGDIALVLSGGGGKGAYQVGAYKAIVEDSRFKISGISGTSVGALNAALFSAKDIKEAEAIWQSLTPDDILSPTADSDFLASDLKLDNFSLAEKLILNDINTENIFTTEFFNDNEFFSRVGLSKIINDTKTPQLLDMTKPICAISAFNLNDAIPNYFVLNELSDIDTEKLLLASSAIPLVFEYVTYNSKNYYDGGFPLFGNNLPMSPLYSLGYRKFIVIHTASSKDTYMNINSIKRNRKLLNEEYFDDGIFLHLFPSKSLGGIREGTLNFDDKYIDETIALGYEDTKKVLQSFNINEFNIEESEIKNYNSPIEKHIYKNSTFSSYNRLLEGLNSL